MAKGMYGSINGSTRKIKKNYAVVGGTTRKIKKMYAVVNGVTRLIFSGSDKIQSVWNGYVYSDSSDGYGSFNEIRALPRTAGSANITHSYQNITTVYKDIYNNYNIYSYDCSLDGRFAVIAYTTQLYVQAYNNGSWTSYANIGYASLRTSMGITSFNVQYTKVYIKDDGEYIALVGVSSVANNRNTYVVFLKNTGTTFEYYKAIQLDTCTEYNSLSTSLVHFNINKKFTVMCSDSSFTNDWRYTRSIQVYALDENLNATSIHGTSKYIDTDYYSFTMTSDIHITEDGDYAIIPRIHEISKDDSSYYYPCWEVLYINNNQVTVISTDVSLGAFPSLGRLNSYGNISKSYDGKTLYVAEAPGSGAYNADLYCFACNGAALTYLGSMRLGSNVCKGHLGELSDGIHGLLDYDQNTDTSDGNNGALCYVSMSKNSNGLITGATNLTTHRNRGIGILIGTEL